jgi:hypothetical protein
LSFTTDDAKWKAFVNANYGKGKLPSPAPHLVEAPISVGRKFGVSFVCAVILISCLLLDGDNMKGWVNPKGKLVWEGAFVGSDGLATLKVESMTEVKLPSKRTCCEQCNVM